MYDPVPFGDVDRNSLTWQVLKVFVEVLFVVTLNTYVTYIIHLYHTHT